MKLGLLITALGIGAVALADPTITDVTARQRYPWNGKVDIVVTITGDVSQVANYDCAFVATNCATQAAIPITAISQIGSDSISGNVCTRRYLWNASNDVGAVKIDDVALTVDVKELGGVQLWENGPYWAECNVGASQPEEYGYYFWWGDTAGYKRNANNDGWVSVKDGTSFEFYSSNCPTYGKDNSQLQSLGYIDSTGNLVAAHDAATVHLGAPWRMPTDAEFSELVSNCDTTWTTKNGVYGRLITGRGAYASKSIFLPAAGYGGGSGLYSTGSYGTYWSSTPYSDYSYDAWILLFYSSRIARGSNGRFCGQSVRPLRGFANADIAVISSGLTTHLSLDCQAGTRTASKTERICFSPAWESDAEGAVAAVSVNGVAVTNATEDGVIEWMPKCDGIYEFTHTVSTNGVAVGEALAATFTVDGVAPKKPTFYPESRTLITGTSLSVSMSCESEDATIHFTTNGTTPTLESPVYKRFKIYGKTTVKAIAFYEDGTPSEMAVAEYARGMCEDPVITPADGTTFLHKDQEVSITALLQIVENHMRRGDPA